MNDIDSREDMIQVSWYLNFRQDEDVSVEEIAESTGLEWGRVHNCVNTLEKIQRLTPDIDYEDKVSIRSPGGLDPDTLEDEAYACLMYIFTVKKYEEDMMEPILVSEHSVLSDREGGIKDAIEIGWLERQGDDSLCLTPQGVGVAGPSHSRIENLD